MTQRYRITVDRIPRTKPKTSAAVGETMWRGSARRRVRRICSSMSRSYTQLKTDADPAEKVPPTTVATTRPRSGTPRAAKNMTGTVVSRSSSMTRGLVSPTYAAMTSRTVARPAVCCRAAEADWPTYVTRFLGGECGYRITALDGCESSPRHE